MRFTRFTQLAVLGAGAVIAFSTLTACGKSSESTPSSTPGASATSSSVVAMPTTGTFIATMEPKNGEPPMVLAVTVDGEHVAAYACNNKNDEGWFFGTQKGGVMELTSKYLDQLKASFDGKSLKTTLTINDVAYTGLAEQAAPPAGIYTSAAGDERASWIVLPDKTVVGVTSKNSKRDRQVIDQINAQQQAFKDQVRQARLQRQLEQSAALNTGSFTSTLNGTTVTALQVTGDMTSPPT